MYLYLQGKKKLIQGLKRVNIEVVMKTLSWLLLNLLAHSFLLSLDILNRFSKPCFLIFFLTMHLFPLFTATENPQSYISSLMLGYTNHHGRELFSLLHKKGDEE